MDQLSQQLERVVLALCEDTNTPRSRKIADLVRGKEYAALFGMKMDPTLYSSATGYFRDNLVNELLRKIQLDVPGIDRAKVALDNFWLSERQCHRTNIRLLPFMDEAPLEFSDMRVYSFIGTARKVIADILGPVPSDLNFGFGPGATFECRGMTTTVPDKMSNQPTITSMATDLLPLWDGKGSVSAWSRARMSDTSTPYYPERIRGNRFTTVPKDALKDRGICIEPNMNLWFQKGVGHAVRRRLARSGIDLDNGQSVHQSLACAASKSGAFATIDLSNASDTVSYNLVKLLLPGMWFDLFDSLRSPYTLVKGKWVRLEKFSSMGNGYTFELETLLFAGLARAVAIHESFEDSVLGRGIWVYGDDIIVPTEIATSVIACLNLFGFTPNESKTFLTGRFRESCGGDFFDGVPVRAHYVKKDPSEPQDYISLANGLRRVVKNHDPSDHRWSDAKRAWHRSLDAIPNSIRRCRGPISFGDLVIHADDWDFKDDPRHPGCGRGVIQVYEPVQQELSWKHWKSDVVLASALYGVPSQGPIPRDSVTGHRLAWRAVLERPPGFSVNSH